MTHRNGKKRPLFSIFSKIQLSKKKFCEANGIAGFDDLKVVVFFQLS
jgi:hypothetical protein